MKNLGDDIDMSPSFTGSIEDDEVYVTFRWLVASAVILHQNTFSDEAAQPEGFASEPKSPTVHH